METKNISVPKTFQLLHQKTYERKNKLNNRAKAHLSTTEKKLKNNLFIEKTYAGK